MRAVGPGGVPAAEPNTYAESMQTIAGIEVASHSSNGQQVVAFTTEIRAFCDSVNRF